MDISKLKGFELPQPVEVIESGTRNGVKWTITRRNNKVEVTADCDCLGHYWPEHNNPTCPNR